MKGWRGARFRDAVERAYDAALYSIRARAVLTVIIIFLAGSSVVVVLWVGAQDVLAGRITAGTLSQFVLFAVLAASGTRPAQRGLGRAGAGVRLRRAAVRDLAHRTRDQGAGKSAAAAVAAARRSRFRRGAVRLSDASPGVRAGRRDLQCARRRKGRDRRAVGRRQEHDLPSAAAVLRPHRRRHRLRRRAHCRRRSARIAPAHRPGAPGHRDLRREHRRQYPVRAARRDHGRDRARRRAGRGRRIHHPPARGLRDPGGRTRRDPVGRPAPAHRHRPRHPARCAAAAARRGDLLARRRERNAGAEGPGAADAGAHHARHRPPPGDGACRATASW